VPPIEKIHRVSVSLVFLVITSIRRADAKHLVIPRVSDFCDPFVIIWLFVLDVLSSLVASSAPQPNASMNGIEVNRPLGPGGGMPGPGMPGPGMPGPGGMSGPGGGMPASGPVQSGPSGPMPPPGWPPSNPPGPQPGMAPGGVPPGGQPRGANQTISAPEMKRAYDALGLQYPGTGQSQHPSGLVNQPGQSATLKGVITCAKVTSLVCRFCSLP